MSSARNVEAPIHEPMLIGAKRVDGPTRIEVRNPGMMRLGMFVTATFHRQSRERHAAVPATAILHLHDRDWVYVPLGGNQFRRVEVVGGDILPGNSQEVTSGISPGQHVVSNALEFQHTAGQ